MGIFGALSTAVTGMRAQSFALENISGNIANSQTVGFKREDPTRANFIYSQLVETSRTFDPNTGMGNSTTPYSGSLPTFLQQLLSLQGQAASNADSLAEGQGVVVNALKQRFNEASGVNVDQEMANLIALQTAYGANARILAVVKEMFDMLMRI